MQGVISASLFGSEHLPLLRLPHDNTALSAFTPPPAPRILVEVFKDEGTDEVERYAIQCLQEARGVLNEGSKRPVDIIRAMSKFSHLMLRRQELASIEGSEVQKQAIDFLRALADQLAPITRRSRSRKDGVVGKTADLWTSTHLPEGVSLEQLSKNQVLLLGTAEVFDSFSVLPGAVPRAAASVMLKLLAQEMHGDGLAQAVQVVLNMCALDGKTASSVTRPDELLLEAVLALGKAGRPHANVLRGAELLAASLANDLGGEVRWTETESSSRLFRMKSASQDILQRSWPRALVSNPHFISTLIKAHSFAPKNHCGAESWLQLYRQFRKPLPATPTLKQMNDASEPYLTFLQHCASSAMSENLLWTDERWQLTGELRDWGFGEGTILRIYAVRLAAKLTSEDGIPATPALLGFLIGFEAHHAITRPDLEMVSELMIHLDRVCREQYEQKHLTFASYRACFSALHSMSAAMNAGRLGQTEAEPARKHLIAAGCSHMTSATALWKHLKDSKALDAHAGHAMSSSRAKLLINLLNEALRALLSDGDLENASQVLATFEELSLEHDFTTCKRVLLGIARLHTDEQRHGDNAETAERADVAQEAVKKWVEAKESGPRSRITGSTWKKDGSTTWATSGSASTGPSIEDLQNLLREHM